MKLCPFLDNSYCSSKCEWFNKNEGLTGKCVVYTIARLIDDCRHAIANVSEVKDK